MEIVPEPELYSPTIDDVGNYVDSIPSFHNLRNGLRCPCGTRKDKAYMSYSQFSAHTKTKFHQKWLSDVNNNKCNFYVENKQLKELVSDQQIIIGRLEKEIHNKISTIDYLTQELINLKRNNEVGNLLDFD